MNEDNTTKEEINVESATFITNNRILVKFNQEINPSSSDNRDKYELIHNDGTTDRKIFPSDITVVDDDAVVLEIPYLLAGGNYTLEIDDIYDISGMYKSPALTVPVDGYVE